MNKFMKNYGIPVLLISVISTGLLFGLQKAGVFDGLELKALDLRFEQRGKRKLKNKKEADRVKIVAIDTDAVEEVGRWPWPRGVLANLVYSLCDPQVMSEGTDDEGWGDIEEEPAEGGAEETAEGAEEDAAEDAPPPAVDPLTVETLSRKNGNVLGIDVLSDRRERPYQGYLLQRKTMLDPKYHDNMFINALNYCKKVTHVSLMKFPEDEAEGWDTGLTRKVAYVDNAGDVVNHLMPLEIFTENIPHAQVGFANMQVSVHDERVRKAQLAYYVKDKKTGELQTLYSFAIMNIAAHLGLEKKDIKFKKGRHGTGWLIVGKYTIPVNEDGEIYINYDFRKARLESAQQFMANTADNDPDDPNSWISPAAEWKNTIMLIGVTDPEVKDVFFTPQGVISGIEVHKEIIDTILQGEYLKDAAVGVVIALILAGAMFVCAGTLLRLWAGVLAVLLYGGAYSLFAISIFKSAGVIYPVMSVLGALPVCLAASMLYRNLVVDREKNQVKNIFKSYVAPHVLLELMDSPGNLKLGGNKSHISVLFSDIRGFTTLSEELSPDILVQGLNHYLERMTQLVLDNSGMIDKFIGDAVMAIWGAPVAHADDARRAVASAVAMGVALDEINPTIKELTGKTFAIGIGVNTGNATLGNIGSSGKLDYTAIGDTVNLASRLEGLTKQYGALVVISEFTYEEVKDHFECRCLEGVMVKGKDKPVGVYQVFCEKGKLDEKTAKLIEQFNKARDLYLSKKFEEAVAAFNKCLEIDPKDKAAKLYIEDRCPHFIQNPPPGEWDGAFRMTTK